MATEAFGARRVTESLKAIARHLDNAAQTAGAVQPLGSKPLPLSPRLTDVIWTRSASHTIKLPLDVNESVNVRGTGLTNITSFKLVAGSTYFEASPVPVSDLDANGQTGTRFTATIPIKAPSVGSYDAWVETEVGSFLLPDACSIEAAAATAPAVEELQLAALVPNQWTEDETQYAVLVVLKGVLKGWSVADVNGSPVDRWSIEKAEEYQATSLRDEIVLLKDIYGSHASYHGLKITRKHHSGSPTASGPRHTSGQHRAFYLVASAAQGPAAKLAFVVKAITHPQQDN